MSKVKFNLREPESKNDTLIMMIFYYNGKKIRLSTGKSINPKYWNKKKNRVKELMEFPIHNSLNQFLEKKSTDINEIYTQYINDDDYIDSDVLKTKVKNCLNGILLKEKTKKNKQFWDYFNDYVEYQRNKIVSVVDYDKSLRKHLLATEKLYSQKTTFKAIKPQIGGFIEDMYEYLTYEAVNTEKSKGLALSTIGKQFKSLKAFLNWCFEFGYIERFSLKHLINYSENKVRVVLTEQEVIDIYNTDFDENTLERVRDGFVLSCHTALRLGDWSRITKSHITFEGEQGYINITPGKTKRDPNPIRLKIPLSTTANKILKKYNYFSPFSQIPTNDFNTDLKRVCKKSGITGEIVGYKQIRGEQIEFTVDRCSQISSHTGRRTFVTQNVLKDVEHKLIMSVSGHKTLSSFEKYIHRTTSQEADAMRKYMD